jgi:hypothetical protein
MDKQVFSADGNRCQQSRMVAIAAARTNRRTAISNCTDPHSYTDDLSRWCSSKLCGDNLSWDIRLVVWRKFHFCCGTSFFYMCNVNYSVFLLRISFYTYMHAWCVSCNGERHNAAWASDSVTVVFISLWKLKFLAYLLNVTQRFVMHTISYTDLVYFIFI